MGLHPKDAQKGVAETLLRPVVQGVKILVPAKERSKKAAGTGSYSATPSLLKKGMLFTAVLRGSTVLEIKDTTYNYDTTTAPAFTDEMVQEQLKSTAPDVHVGPGEDLAPED